MDWVLAFGPTMQQLGALSDNEDNGIGTCGALAGAVLGLCALLQCTVYSVPVHEPIGSVGLWNAR